MIPSSLPVASDTSDASDAPDVPATGNRTRRRWYWGIGLLLLTGLVLGAVFVPTPYVLIHPGAVRPAEERIVVEGTESFPNDASVLFTTVFVDEATLFGLLSGALDDAIEVRSSEEVYGDRGRDEMRRLNRREMDLSKLMAEREALRYLGYDASFAADGVRVVDVAEDVPAAEVLRPDDVIVSVDDEPVTLPEELRSELEAHAPGDSVTLGIRRSSLPAGESASRGRDAVDSLSVGVELTAAEAEPRPGQDSPGDTDGETDESVSRAALGVIVEPFNPRIESEVNVKVDSGDVTGPSAGLAWALAIIDVLTPGSLTGDRDVAVTGEILADGSVGVIGGTAQKTATVVRNDVDVFLFPAGTSEEDQAEMRRIAGDDTELVPVASLAEAVEYLAPDGIDVD
jgi:PDZ domain-containing protein